MKKKKLDKYKAKAKELTYNLSALYVAYKRKDVSIYAKIIIIIAIGYALSPIDLVPDFIPVLGYLDDLLIVSFLVFIAIKLIPKQIMDECKEQGKDLWREGKPKKWYYAVPIVIIWLLVIFIIVEKIFFNG